jgi:hypothetical protein
MVLSPVVWGQYEQAYTNKPVPYSSTILIPRAAIPQAGIVPQATAVEIPVAGVPQPPVSSGPASLNSPFRPAAGIPHPTTADVARRRVQVVAPPLPVLTPVTQIPLPANVAAPVPTAKPLPAIDAPILFNTPRADAILATMQVFPSNNTWHADISQWPVHPRSTDIISTVGAWRPLECNQDMGFVIAPKNAPRASVKIAPYAAESDPGPYPLPENLPIEGWPVFYQRSMQFNLLTLDDVQRDVRNLGGDRHAIVVDPSDQKLYEFYSMRKTKQGWQAAQASIFDLSANKLRPDGWTSADAAGLPIFPAVVRYDELVRGEIDHALRVTVLQSRKAYVAPATHYASKLADENLPRMGERFRLRQSYNIASFSPEVQTILKALKKHGMFVADNGGIVAISVTPDERIRNVLTELNRVTVADFEIVTAPR